MAVVVIGVTGVVIPRAFLHDDPTLNSDEVACAKLEAGERYDNPLQQIAVKLGGFVVTAKDQQHYRVSAHTLFGLRFAQITVPCKWPLPLPKP